MNAYPSAKSITLGVMSGTSLDGVDAVAVDFAGNTSRLLGHHAVAFDKALREELLALCTPGENEIERAMDASQHLASVYAQTILELLDNLNISREKILAAGVHGQTVRHRPEKGWSLQLNAPALLAELTGIDIVADFRSRDLAAGGEGAPLVPAFHAALFRAALPRAIVNIGGIANVTLLPGRGDSHTPIRGFDCAPGNILMDAWCAKHCGTPYDLDGLWAEGGKIEPALLERLSSHPFFARPAPKSTGREDFNLAWLESHCTGVNPQDVQRTLLALTARYVVQACEGFPELYLCGGGAKNKALFSEIARLAGENVSVASTTELGVDPMHVEAMAFAWLAQAFFKREPGNLCDVTRASGVRTLGALYPH